MLYKLRIRVVMQNRYLVIVLGVRLLWESAGPGRECNRAYGRRAAHLRVF